ncbi:MAG: hypothetical protein RJQ09_14485 [Cyclobacteriaceae bacterium]
MKLLFTLLGLTGFILSSSAQHDVTFSDLELTQTNDRTLLYEIYSGKTDLQIDASEVKKINMETGAGAVKILQSIDDVFRVEAEIIISSNSVASALDIIEQNLDLGISGRGDELYFVSIFDYEDNFDTDSDSRFRPFNFFKAPARKVNIHVFVPKGIAIKINDRSGELTFEGLNNDLDITDGSGNIKIRDVVGNVILVDYSGEIKIDNVNEGLAGQYLMDIEDTSGGLSLHNVSAHTKIQDSSGGIYVDAHNGDLDITDTSGGITVSQVVGSIRINDASGGMQVTGVEGNVEVTDNSGEIYINRVSENVIVRDSGSGGLNVQNVAGDVRGDVRKLY